jgi:8-oxo-dGTP diphosphatase
MIRVAAAIIFERVLWQGRVLICQRRRGERFELQWEFPGGKVRPSETPQAALARELREELSVAVHAGREVYRTRHSYREMPGELLQIRFFAAHQPFPVPRNLVFERIKWVQAGDLPRYDFLPADRALVARLARGEIR